MSCSTTRDLADADKSRSLSSPDWSSARVSIFWWLVRRTSVTYFRRSASSSVCRYCRERSRLRGAWKLYAHDAGRRRGRSQDGRAGTDEGKVPTTRSARTPWIYQAFGGAQCKCPLLNYCDRGSQLMMSFSGPHTRPDLSQYVSHRGVRHQYHRSCLCWTFCGFYQSRRSTGDSARRYDRVCSR